MKPRRLLAVDLATTTGWALFVEGQLESFGQIDGHSDSSSSPPYDTVDKVRHIAARVHERVILAGADIIVVEETNIGGRAGQASQRFLEWAHLALLVMLDVNPGRSAVRYLQSRQWRSAIGLVVSAADKKQNKLLSQIKSKLRAKLGRGPTAKELVAAKADAGISGKRTIKHASVDWANTRHQLNLKKTQADAADAICLGEAYLILNPLKGACP